MAKRPTQLEKAIAKIDEEIAALQLARKHLEQQRDAAMKLKPMAE